MTVNDIENHRIQNAIFAGGCFWCTEPVFSQLRGVIKVVSGYTGGHTLNPTYRDICEGDTGHAEAIQITYDSTLMDYATLVEIFLTAHDPTTLNRQGADVGTQYRSAIFYLNEDQQTSAFEVIKRFEAEHVYPDPIVTEVSPATVFYPAEDYHQYYYAKNPGQPYCIAVAAPKVAKIRKLYAQYMK